MRSYDEVIRECGTFEEDGAKVETVGLSRHGNKIPLVSLGSGDTSILIVCRQHGNEPTSTEAMLYYMKEIQTRPIRQKIRLHVIPIANPDGAKIYERICKNRKTNLLTSYAARSNRAYLGDINRDHKKRKTPEAQAIFNTVRRVQPKLMLDLHNFFPAYRYFIFQKKLYNFCPAVSLHSKIKLEIRQVSHALAKVCIEAVKEAGGNPAKINELWPGLDGRLTTVNENILETYYPLYHDIPALTLEALGGFNLCNRSIGLGKQLHKVAVDGILHRFVSM